MILQVESREMAGGVTALDLKGRICLGRDSQQVEWKVDELVKAGKAKVIFDMSGVTLVDSTGVGIIVTCFGRLKKAGGELRLAGVQSNVKGVFSMTQLDTIIQFFPSVETASTGF